MAQHDLDYLGWEAGTDGASIVGRPTGRPDIPDEDDATEELLGAWLVERSKSVEAELLLGRTCHILSRLITASSPVSVATRREIRHLIAEIRDQLR